MSNLSVQSFKSITDLFHRVSGIRLTDAKQALVQGRLQKLAHDAGETDVERYVQHLLHGGATAEELTRLVDKLTTNETYFFREPEHFNDLTARLEAARSQPREFTIWSAASSSGEEAYSIAMLMADKWSPRPWSVIGTDLSTAMVDSARRALYSLDRARMVPQAYLKKFCLKGEGQYEGQLLISRDLREHVRFESANLMKDLPSFLPQFDVIFLRNVLIYFDNPAKASIVNRVIKQLKPDGVLYVGHAESLAALNLPLRVLAPAVYTHV